MTRTPTRTGAATALVLSAFAALTLSTAASAQDSAFDQAFAPAPATSDPAPVEDAAPPAADATPVTDPAGADEAAQSAADPGAASTDVAADPAAPAADAAATDTTATAAEPGPDNAYEVDDATERKLDNPDVMIIRNLTRSEIKAGTLVWDSQGANVGTVDHLAGNTVVVKGNRRNYMIPITELFAYNQHGKDYVATRTPKAALQAVASL